MIRNNSCAYCGGPHSTWDCPAQVTEILAPAGGMFEPDPVNHPKHYKLFPDLEAIDVIQRSLTPEEFAGYCKGNALKYRLRAGEKGDANQDLAKSNWYRDKLVSVQS